MKKLISTLLKLVILYLILFLVYNSILFLSNSHYLKQVSIKYLLLPQNTAIIFNKAFLLFTFSMIAMIMLSRGHLWMYGINSLNFNKYIYKYLVLLVLIFILFFRENNNELLRINSDSNVSVFFQYFTTIIIWPIAFVIFYLGLVQSWISKKIFYEYESIIYKLNATIVILILVISFENFDISFSNYLPIILINSVVYLFSKSLLIPLIGQILLSLLILLRQNF